MKIKLYLSSLALVLFALIGGGSFSGEEIGTFFTILLVVVGITIVAAMITSAVQSKNKKKRLQMIKEDEQQSTDFDRSVFIGDDRCKLYFDASKKKVMIMRVMTEGIKKNMWMILSTLVRVLLHIPPPHFIFMTQQGGNCCLVLIMISTLFIK